LKYKIIIILTIITLISVNLFGCTNDLDTFRNSQSDVDESVDYLIVESGQLVLPLTPFNTLNPLMTNNLNYHYFSKLIFEGLFEFNENLETIPKLATEYIIKNNGKTILVKLREDVYWHDGEKFTASDVIFTINALNNSTAETAYSTIISNTFVSGSNISSAKIVNARIIDDYSIEIDFEQALGNNIEALTFPIISSHVFNSVGRNIDYSKALELENYEPIGTGPFKFVSYDKHKSVNLESNENYRDGKPRISSVVGKVLENEELFLTAYEAGQINITPAIGVDWDKYKQNSRIKTVEYISSNYEFMGFNFSNNIFSGEGGLAIRKAINYGIDRQEIIQKVFLGHATQTDVPIYPASWLIAEEANFYGHNTEMAKELLVDARFMDNDGDGILENIEGTKLSFRMVTNPSNQYRFRVAEMIRENLKEIGIEIILQFDTSYKQEVTKEEVTSEWENINTIITKGDYDIALLGWHMSVIPDLSFMLHSNQENYGNFIKYKNPTMDSLLDLAKSSINKEDRLLAYKDLQRFIVDDLPYISLFYRNKALLIDTKIMGEINPNLSNLYNGLDKCYIVTKSN